MNVGMIGLGKLGLPVAYAMAARGLDVYGYDPHVKGPPDDCSHEDRLAETIAQADGRLRFCPLLEDVVARCDVLFVACQTPHEKRFEGVTPLPEDRADFDYSYLKRAVLDIGNAAVRLNRYRQVTVAVISTVLPGTVGREIRTLPMPPLRIVYNPSFIAMGTTIRDFLDPEFVLLGGDDEGVVEHVYEQVLPSGATDFYSTSVENAELIKVAYNTFIGLKIAFANTLMEVCHKTGCDVDEVTGALKLAHRRLISPAYMDGGMGDGGGCHPRDNIALSWLADELDLSHDLFEDVMYCREDQAEWLVDLMCEHDLPKSVVGLQYKPGSKITTGSPSMLCKNLLERRGHEVRDSQEACMSQHPHVFLIGCREERYADPEISWPYGSVIIDPFRYIPDQPGVEVIRVGQHPSPVHRQAGTAGELRQAAA